MIRLVAAAVWAAVLMLDSSDVSAQASQLSEQGYSLRHADEAGETIDGNRSAIIGGVLLGMEVGVLMPPLFKLHDRWWAWTLFPVLGAAVGGTVASIPLILGNSYDAPVGVGILAAGAALVIPAIVGALAIKARRESADVRAANDVGPGLVRFNRGGTFLRAPALSVASSYPSSTRLSATRLRATSVHVPLVSGHF